MKPISAVIAAFSLFAVIVTTNADAAGAAKATTAVERRLDHCSWDRPGVDPFMGDVVAAVDDYRDIAPETRQKLKARMVKRDYDEIVSIDRDGIRGKATYGTTIRDMHFGTNQVCGGVTRASWRPDTKERGLVYCEGRECILVPTVCRNVSRISRAEVLGGGATEGDAAPATALAAAPAAALAEAPALAAPAVANTDADAERVNGAPISGFVATGGGEPRSFAALSGGGTAGFAGGSTTAGGSGGGGGGGRGIERTGGVPGKDSEGRPVLTPGTLDTDLAGSTPFAPRSPDGSEPLTGPITGSATGPIAGPIAGPITAVPEPQSLLLMASGLVVLVFLGRRKSSRRE